MILTSPTRIVCTYLVWRAQDDRPHTGDAYRDPRGRIWTINHVGAQVVLGGPETAGLTPWSIDLASESGVIRLDPGETLRPFRTSRSGTAWEGYVEHDEGIAFGGVCQRLPGQRRKR